MYCLFQIFTPKKLNDHVSNLVWSEDTMHNVIYYTLIQFLYQILQT